MNFLNQQLFEAAISGKLEALAAVLDAGAHINAHENTQGDTALHKTAEHGYTDCLNLLLERGANVEAMNSHNTTALHKAAVYGRVDCVALLLKAGADPGAKTINGWTALFHAAGRGQLDCLTLLIKTGTDVTVRNSAGDTALHLAAINGHTDCLNPLLERGAHINIKNETAFTPLQLAVTNRHSSTATSLLHYGADESGVDKERFAPILSEMRDNVTKTFISDTITRGQCITNDDPPQVTDAVLNALYLGQFKEKVARKLIDQGEEGKALLSTIIGALPERIKSLHASMLTALEQELQPQRSFVERIPPSNPTQGQSR